jgi:NAD(P)-dependent dehydrogenase (short-subunit alcohol dehydrogenase family)
MGKLDGKVAVITGGSSGMALASAKRFVEEGAYVFITGRRQEQIDEAVKLIGRNVTGVCGDAANLDDLDRLFDTVKREKGKINVLFASAGMGEADREDWGTRVDLRAMRSRYRALHYSRRATSMPTPSASTEKFWGRPGERVSANSAHRRQPSIDRIQMNMGSQLRFTAQP